MRKSIIFLILTVLGLAGFLIAYGMPAATIAKPSLHWETADERSDSMEALRLAWDGRNRTPSSEADAGERVFINRLASFSRHVRGTETFGEATSLLTQASREHSADYGKD